MKVNSKLAEVASQILKVNPKQLSLKSSTDTVEAWDSLGHLRLVLKVEEKFGVKFLTEEIPQLTNLDRLQKALSQKGAL